MCKLQKHSKTRAQKVRGVQQRRYYQRAVQFRLTLHAMQVTGSKGYQIEIIFDELVTIARSFAERAKL